jgi:hypothetical protein
LELCLLFRAWNKRHSFAVNALLRWYRSGEDVQAKLPLLSTYLGHVSVVSTHYYLTFIEELRCEASIRFYQHCGNVVRPNPSGEGVHYEERAFPCPRNGLTKLL